MTDINTTHIITTIVGVFIACEMGDIIRRLYRMEKKQDEQAQKEAECRENLKNYATWDGLMGEAGIITKIERDRSERWRSQEDLNRKREGDISQLKTKTGLS